jgi:hypothetical protein
MEVGFMKRFTAITMITAIMAVLLATFVPIMVGASGDDFGIRFTTDADDRLQLDTEGSVFKQTDGEKAWAKFITKYRNFIVGVSGIGAVTMVGVFILNFMKLGIHSTSNKRSDVLIGLIWSGAAAAGLGAVAFIVGFFYNAIT